MLNDFKNQARAQRIIVALDCGREEALALGDALRGHASWVKVGLTLLYQCGPEIVKELKDKGLNVFLDVKLHDIPHQIEGAACSVALTGADMFTMHTLGGTDMLTAGKRGAEQAAAEIGMPEPITLGVTVLTSMDDETLAQVGIRSSALEQVKLLAGVAKASGISGVVASPHEAVMLREVLGPDAFIVTPGVRPAGSEVGDQSRVATPREAFEAGASHIVIGRPITKAADPVASFDAIAASVS